MLHVTKTFLPPLHEYVLYLEGIWERGQLTNNGILVQELEQKIKSYLNFENCLYTSNGTIVLQMALKILNISKEVITTPFSYVATLNTILWEGCQPVFVDINPETFCIEASKIEEKITSETQAILATHVFGNMCDVDKIEKIAQKHNLKVIYDAAHAFGTQYKGKTAFSYGDLSTCSFHATKLFHTVEGGMIAFKDKELQEKLKLIRSFGHFGDDYSCVGINAKNSEFHAAMGLAVMPYFSQILEKRKQICQKYSTLLDSKKLQFLKISEDSEYNYAYFPLVFSSETVLEKVLLALSEKEIFPRRYFYPSLNTLSFLNKKQECPISESISKRIICLPLSYYTTEEEVKLISEIINQTI